MSDSDVRLKFRGPPLDPAEKARVLARLRDEHERIWWVFLEHGPLDACRKNYESLMPHNLNLYRFMQAVGPVLPPEQGKYAVFGCAAYNCYCVPRETSDIDIAVSGSWFSDVVGPIMKATPPDFTFEHLRIQTRAIDPANTRVGDLFIAEANPVLEEALRDPRATHRIHVPRLGEAWTVKPEVIVATKYYAGSIPARGTKRFQDVHDMLAVFSQPENQPIDMDLLWKLVRCIPLSQAESIFHSILERLKQGKLPYFPWGQLDD